MIYVIGSGPTGVACALPLVKKGLPVTMIDAGIELETEVREILHVLSAKDKSEWNEKLLDKLRHNFLPGMDGKPLKFIYGSDFPYRETGKHIRLDVKGVEIFPSLAKGGLSNAWGAAVLPYSDDDLTGWPIQTKDLAPHYEAIFSFMHLSAVEDDLKDLYPFYSHKFTPLNPSRQAHSFMRDALTAKTELKSAGFHIGHSRLAVQNDFNKNKDCVYCGMCLHGCPYGLIYSSVSTLNLLKQYPNFGYIPNVIVERIEERGTTVRIVGHDRINEEPVSFEGSRAFLACGTVPTTKILLASLDAYDQPVYLKDSQYFLFPLLRYKAESKVSAEELYTLAQIFIELKDGKLSEHTVHMQAYTYNDFYLIKFKDLLKGLFPLFRAPLEHVLGRLLIIQGFLHSDLSSKVEVRLKREGKYKKSYLELSGGVTEQSRGIVDQILNKFWKARNSFRAVPIKSQLKVEKPGKGFHVGGSFPMKEIPGRFESDIWGRPSGFKRVHAVDSTIFPSIPAPTITLNIMANAHRIAETFSDN